MVKNLPANARDADSILGSGRTPEERNDNLLQYSCLENSMDRGAWRAAVHRVARVGHDFTFTFTFYFHALEKEMATHTSVLAWRIPWTEKPGGLQAMGSLRVGHE